jgi:hypothetical protein
MNKIISNGSSATKSVKTIFVLTALVVLFAFGFLVGTGYNNTISKFNLIFSSATKSNNESSLNKQEVFKSFFSGYNSTHLWSMRLADENYLRLARLLPCRVVNYTGGPKIDPIDSCDHSSTNEYSRSNTLQAQKWLYEHQHPANCSDKRFAIIQNFAWSGYGSTVHQIVWAFAMAMADSRIAVYQTPGNWVSQNEVYF